MTHGANCAKLCSSVPILPPYFPWRHNATKHNMNTNPAPRPFATAFDLALIAAVILLALNFPGFEGGFGWCLLLALSPRAWR